MVKTKFEMVKPVEYQRHDDCPVDLACAWKQRDWSVDLVTELMRLLGRVNPLDDED